MKKVYYKIIDPVNDITLAGCRVYPDYNYRKVVEVLLKELGINADDYRERTPITNAQDSIPGMPEYYMTQGYVYGTSKLVSITVVG
jgi:hypothetical protein